MQKSRGNFYIISICINLSIVLFFYFGQLWRIYDKKKKIHFILFYNVVRLPNNSYASASHFIEKKKRKKEEKTHVDYLSRPQVILKRCSGVWERCHWTRWSPYPWKDWNSPPPLDPAWTELWLIQEIQRIRTSPCKWTRSIRWTTFYCGRTS